jgi:hypothetical protein
MKFEVENLIEDYNRRIKNAEDLLVELRKGKSSETETRLFAKISAWITFVAELNQILQND